VIATNDGIYVDECDPLFDVLETYKTWAVVKRCVGRTLNRLLAGDYILISSAEDYPDYRAIKTEINDACRSVNAKNRVPLSVKHQHLARGPR
jgi:hypothetical protein